MPKRLLRMTAAGVAKRVDRAFASTALNPPRMLRRRSSAEGLDPAARMRGLAAIASFYNREPFRSRESALLPRPSPIAPAYERVRKLGSAGEVLDLEWASDFRTLWTAEAVAEHFESLPAAERDRLGFEGKSVEQIMNEIGIDRSAPLHDKYLRARRNQTAHARWFRHHGAPRACAVLLHGYMGGAYALEERLWPVEQLFDRGMDVVLTVLPFHGPRRSEQRGLRPPAFPSGDPRFTIEGLRQLVGDHTALFDYLLDGRVSSLGVMGTSLGGYGSALLATLDARLRFAVLLIPLAAIEDFAHTHGRLIGDEQQQEAQRAALSAAQWMVSPLARPALVPGERVQVLAGESDAVTGLAHARRLSAHFDAGLTTFEGGHLLQFGRARAFAPVWQMLERTGLFGPDPTPYPATPTTPIGG